jgi:tetratricopeptide (TPR) repeat protein
VKTLQIFISSPGDVYEERAIANRVIDRIQSEYVGRLVLEPVLWEHEPLVATANFQEQIVKPSDTDIVIAILWARLGTRLPKGFTREDGSRYNSGTEYEFEEAIAGFRKTGKPDLLVYRKTAPSSVRLDDERELMERLEQKKKLDDFVEKWFHDKSEGTLVAAFHAFESPGDFENLLEAHLHKLVDRQLPSSVSAKAEAPAVWKKGSPFRGLHAFQFEHAPVFFGRTKAVSDILQALRDQAADGRPFVLILGMSGGGKSSVARAGVLPMLTQPRVIEGVGLWRRAVFRPSDVPGNLFTGLATALLRENALPALDPESNGPAELAQILRQSPPAAVSLIKTALAQEVDKRKSGNGRDPGARLALLVDQMEEMFTQEDILPRDRKAFVNTLDVLSRSGRVWIIATLRSDFYPRLANFPKLGALKEGAGQYDLMPPNASEIGQMIRLPTRAAGLRFEEDPTSSERLDDMLRDAAVEHPEVLPLLQFTLEELYQRRTDDGMLTLGAYRELGGVEGCLAQRAESIFQELPSEVQAALTKVLNALVSIEQDGHETIGRKRAPWYEASKEESQILLDKFVEARLFVTELADDGSAVVTVAHEALLWHWPRVREWVAQNRENLRIRSRITAAADRWVNERKRADLLLPRGKPLGEAESLIEHDIELDEIEVAFISASVAKVKRIQQIKAGVVASLAVLGLVAASSAYIANQQRTEALQQRARAEIEAETAKQTTDFMVGLFAVSDPSEALGNTITAREILDKGAKRIDAELTDQPEIQATLMDTMGSVYKSLGLYDQATPLLERSLQIRRQAGSQDDLNTADTMNRLGDVLSLKAEYQTAEMLHRDALAVRRELLGAEHVLVAESLQGLAYVLTFQGDYAGAEPLLREALKTRRKLLGLQNPEVAQSLEELGLNIWDQGDDDGAEPWLRESVQMRRDLFGGDPHPDLAEGVNNLGLLLWSKGDYFEAEELFREALEMNKMLLDEFHPTIAVNLNNLALLLHDMGDYEAAEPLYRDVIAMRKQTLGEVHPEVALVLNNLASLLYDKGDREAAMAMQRQAVDMSRRLFPEGHPNLAIYLGTLGSWLTSAENYGEADPLLHESVDMRKRILGDEHSQVAIGMTALAHLYLATGRIEKARTLSHDAGEMITSTLSADHWRVAWAASVEGASLAHLGEYEEAEQMLLTSHARLEQEPGSGSRKVYIEITAGFLADLYRGWGKASQASQ